MMAQNRGLPPEDALKKLMQDSHIPGMSIASVADGKIQTASLGIADVESKKAVTENTVFWACSLSKPVFAYLIIKLIQDGKLEKEFLDAKLWDETRLGKRGDKEWLTPRLLLSHQTGLPNEGPASGVLEFKFKPGEGYQYSGTGFLFLQKILEERTGESLEDLAKQHLFIPLGMIHSSFSMPAAETMAEGHDDYQHHQQRCYLQIGNNRSAAGSLHTTADDYARFLQHCMNDKDFMTLLIPQKINMERDIEAKGKVDERTLHFIDWGLGWGIQKHHDREIAFHWGHGDGARAFVALDLTAKNAVVYFTNSTNGLAPVLELMRPVGDMACAMRFLSGKYGYKHYQDLSFIENRSKHVPVTEEEHDLNVKRLAWLEDLVKAKSEPIQISRALLLQYAGEYPPNKVTVNGNKLELELFGEKHQLIPIDETTFASMTDLTFRIQFDIKNKQAITHFLYPNVHLGNKFELLQPKTNVLEKMLNSSLEKFNVSPERFRELINDIHFQLLLSESPIAAHERNFIEDHKEDFDSLTALAIERRKYLTAIFSSEKGIESLEQKLITFNDIMKMPHPHHARALLSEHGNIAMKEGLITPKDAMQFGENSTLYLLALCTEEGIQQLRKHKSEGSLQDMMAIVIDHARQHNNVGVLEHALKENIPVNMVQAEIDRNKKPSQPI